MAHQVVLPYKIPTPRVVSYTSPHIASRLYRVPRVSALHFIVSHIAFRAYSVPHRAFLNYHVSQQIYLPYTIGHVKYLSYHVDSQKALGYHVAHQKNLAYKILNNVVLPYVVYGPLTVGASTNPPTAIVIAGSAPVEITVSQPGLQGQFTANSLDDSVVFANIMPGETNGPNFADFQLVPVSLGNTQIIWRGGSGQQILQNVAVQNFLSLTASTTQFAPTGTVTISQPSYTGTITLAADLPGIVKFSQTQVQGPGPVTVTVTGLMAGATNITATNQEGQQATVGVDIVVLGDLTVTPSALVFAGSTSTPQTIVVSRPNYGASITAVMADGSFATVAPTSEDGPTVTFTVTPIATAVYGGDDAVIFTAADESVIVPVSVLATATLTNLIPDTLGGTLSYIRALTDCPALPNDAVITTFLNRALQEAADNVDEILVTTSIAAIPGNPTITLPFDIKTIVAFTYSTTLPTQVGGIEYELQELGSLEFVDATGGMPQVYGIGSGAGPVLWYRMLSDVAGRQRMQFTPAPPAGYLNIQYHARPLYFIPGNNASITNIDPAFLEMAILYTCMNICLNRKDLVRYKAFKDQYTEMKAEKKETIGRRRRQKNSQVRDVTSEAYNIIPSWFPN